MGLSCIVHPVGSWVLAEVQETVLIIASATLQFTTCFYIDHLIAPPKSCCEGDSFGLVSFHSNDVRRLREVTKLGRAAPGGEPVLQPCA